MARASLREGRKPKSCLCDKLRGNFLYYVYILQSLKTGRLYVGHTNDIERRFEEHNSSKGGKYSRQNAPWKLLYQESHPDRSSAAKRELYLKSTKGSQEKKLLAGILQDQQ